MTSINNNITRTVAYTLRSDTPRLTTCFSNLLYLYQLYHIRKYDGDDSVMFFDTRDNYISPKTLRENIKKNLTNQNT
jgi:hypothetical protein